MARSFEQFADEFLSDIRRPRPKISLPPSRIPPIPEPSIETPPPPGIAGRMADALMGALGAAKKRVDIASNYYSNPVLRERVLAGDDPVPSEQLLKEGLIAPPDASMSKEEQYARSIGRGLTQAGGAILTDPVSMLAMGGALKAANPVLRKAADVGFSALMARGMYEGGKEAVRKFRESGMSPAVAEELAKVGVDAGLMAFPHLIGGKAEPGVAEGESVRPVAPAEETGFALRPEEKGFALRPETPLPESRRLEAVNPSEILPPLGANPFRPLPESTEIIDAEVISRPRLTATGEGLPSPDLPVRMAQSDRLAKLQGDLNSGLVDEIEAQARTALAEGDYQRLTELVAAREAAREAAWQQQPGQAANLRQPFALAGGAEAQGPDLRPQMLAVRSELLDHLARATTPDSRVKIQLALNSLEAQLRQRPTPTLPQAQPQLALPAGEPQPVQPPAPTPAPEATVPSQAPAPIPSAEVAPSGQTLAGAGAEPAVRAAEATAAQRPEIAALVQAAQQHAVGLETPVAEKPTSGAPVVVTGSEESLASRAAAPPEIPAPVPAVPAEPPVQFPQALREGLGKGEFTHQELAARTGMRPEDVVDQLMAASQAGLVRYNGKKKIWLPSKPKVEKQPKLVQAAPDAQALALRVAAQNEGRLTAQALQDAGLDAKAARATVRSMEVDGLVEFRKRQSDYHLTKKGQSAAQPSGEGPLDPYAAAQQQEAAIEAAKDKAGRVQWKKVPEPEKDEQGNRILPGQEEWIPERRKLVHSTAEAVSNEVTALERAEPTRGKTAILNDQGQTDYNVAREGGAHVGAVPAVGSARPGTALEAVNATPKKIAKALKRDKANPTELDIHEKVDQWNQIYAYEHATEVAGDPLWAKAYPEDIAAGLRDRPASEPNERPVTEGEALPASEEPAPWEQPEARVATAKDAEGNPLIPGFLEAVAGTPIQTEGNLPGPMFEAKTRRTPEPEQKALVEPQAPAPAPADVAAQALTMYGDSVRAWDALRRQAESLRGNKLKVDPEVEQAIQDLQAKAAKELGLEGAPHPGTEGWADFEARADSALADMRRQVEAGEAAPIDIAAAMRRRRSSETGAASIEAIASPFVLPAKAVGWMVTKGVGLIRGGLTRFGPWSKAMADRLGGALANAPESLRHIWRWIRGMFGPAATSEPSAPTVPGAPAESTAPATEATPGKLPGVKPPKVVDRSKIGVGESVSYEAGKGPRYEASDFERRADEFQGPLRENETPSGTDYPINVNRIASEGDLRELLHRSVEANKGAYDESRGYQSWKDAERDAMRAGLSDLDYKRIIKERGALNPAELKGAGNVYVELGKGYRAAKARADALRAEQGADAESTVKADLEKYAALSRLNSFTSYFIAARSGAGRALGILRSINKGISKEDSWYQRTLRDALKKEVPEELLDKLGEAAANKDHAAMAKLSREIFKPTWLDKVTEWYINGLISGPATSAANVVGNWGHENLLRTPERGLAGLIDQVMAKYQGREPERFPQEANAALKANLKTGFGFKGNIGILRDALLYEDPLGIEGIKGEHYRGAIGGTAGRIIRAPGRLMNALDVAARSAAYEAESGSQAIRQAYSEGFKQKLRGKELSDFVANHAAESEQQFAEWRKLQSRVELNGVDDLTAEQRKAYENPAFQARHKAASESAAVSTFQDTAPDFAQAILHVRQKHKWMSLFVPFVSTPSNILKQAVKRTPFGLAMTGKDIAVGKLRGGAAADELAKGIWGSTIGATMYGLASSGLITGSGPTNPDEQRAWRNTGKQPYSVKIGDKWVSMARIEPIATVLGLSADLAEAKDSKKAGDVTDKLVATLTNNIMSKTYIDGLASLIEAVQDPERAGGAFVKKTVGSLVVPNLIASAARAIDPEVRDTSKSDLPLGLGYVVPPIVARIPGLSETLPSRMTGTGEPIKREENPISTFLSPFRYSEEKGPEANLERSFLASGYIPAQPPRELTLPGTMGKKIPLTRDEREIYNTFTGRATAVARQLVQGDEFQKLDPEQQEYVLKHLYRLAHDAAKPRVMQMIAARTRGAA